LASPADRISKTQSGTTSSRWFSGTVGIGSRRRPAESRTMTSVSRMKWISGSGLIHHPPGESKSRRWTGLDVKLAPDDFA
jgi:hypothetical protein